MDKTSSLREFSQREMIEYINRDIEYARTDADYENLTEYRNASEMKNIEINRAIKKCLSLPYTTNGEKTNYPEIKITL